MSYTAGRGEVAPDHPLDRVALNLAAPGDHAGPDGAVWFRQGLGDRKKKRTGNAAGIDVTIEPASVQAFSAHPLRLRRANDGALPFVAASGFEGVETLRIALCAKAGEQRAYAVRLHFAEPGGAKPGERLFSVSLQGREVIAGLDVARAAGGPLGAIVREFHNVATDREIRIDLRAIAPGRPPLLCGVAIGVEHPMP
jgi:hypothetical protein